MFDGQRVLPSQLRHGNSAASQALIQEIKQLPATARDADINSAQEGRNVGYFSGAEFLLMGLEWVEDI